MTHILIVGCGKMGGALLERWQHADTALRIEVIDPSCTHAGGGSTQFYQSLEQLPQDSTPNVVVLAVKPQQLDSVLPHYATRFASRPPLYISIAAGKTLPYYQRILGAHAHVVRAMPNTPALIGEGVSVLVGTNALPASARSIATQLMRAAGHVEWLEDESLMDAVTALSGCGPAYLFLFAEALAEAGTQAGLSPTLARALALKTMQGSASLASQSSKSLEQLRIDVASPGGATEAALAQLMAQDALKTIIFRASAAAQKRSKELSN